MKTYKLVLLALLAQTPASAALRIVATVPDLADITRRIGGELVEVESLAKGTEDIHAVPQRPSFIPRLNKADGVVLIGLEIEHTFLPALLEVAQNPNILRGRKGYIDCAEDVSPMDVPETLSRSEGELHPHGNPHYNMDPRKAPQIADAIMRGLARLDPKNAATYKKNRDTFEKEWSAKMAEWKVLAAPARGKLAVSHHADMVYFADYLGLHLVGTVELKPGIPPTPTHLQKLAKEMKEKSVPVLIREIQYSDKTARWLSEITGAKIAVVATMGGAFPDTQTYFGMIEHNIQSIIDALH